MTVAMDVTVLSSNNPRKSHSLGNSFYLWAQVWALTRHCLSFSSQWLYSHNNKTSDLTAKIKSLTNRKPDFKKKIKFFHQLTHVDQLLSEAEHGRKCTIFLNACIRTLSSQCFSHKINFFLKGNEIYLWNSGKASLCLSLILYEITSLNTAILGLEVFVFKKI